MRGDRKFVTVCIIIDEELHKVSNIRTVVDVAVDIDFPESVVDNRFAFPDDAVDMIHRQFLFENVKFRYIDNSYVWYIFEFCAGVCNICSKDCSVVADATLVVVII